MLAVSRNLCALQIGGVCFTKTPKRQQLTRSLLSGLEKSPSTRFESDGGSSETAPVSKPYMLRSAADAASAAIDYSKGNIDDGVVDSPPSRASGRTPICSPSPLKRSSWSRDRTGRSLSRVRGRTLRQTGSWNSRLTTLGDILVSRISRLLSRRPLIL